MLQNRCLEIVYYFYLFDQFYIALFSALEYTHTALMSRVFINESLYLFIVLYLISTEVM